MKISGRGPGFRFSGSFDGTLEQKLALINVLTGYSEKPEPPPPEKKEEPSVE